MEKRVDELINEFTEDVHIRKFLKLHVFGRVLMAIHYKSPAEEHITQLLVLCTIFLRDLMGLDKDLLLKYIETADDIFDKTYARNTGPSVH